VAIVDRAGIDPAALAQIVVLTVDPIEEATVEVIEAVTDAKAAALAAGVPSTVHPISKSKN
jgi:hypothetical protein